MAGRPADIAAAPRRRTGLTVMQDASALSGDDPRRFTWDIVYEHADYKTMAGAYARRRRQARKPASRVVYAVVWLALVALFVMLFQTGRAEVPPFLAGFVVGVLALCLGIWLYNRLILVRSAGKLNALEGKIINTVVDAAGVRSNTDISSARWIWAAFEWVDETDSHYFLWPNAVVVLMIPKRVFRDAEEGRQFAAALKDWTSGTENVRRRALAEAVARR